MADRPALAYQPYNSKRLSQQSLHSAGPSTPLDLSPPSATAAPATGGSARPSPFIRPGHSRPGSGFDFALPNGRPSSVGPGQANSALLHGSAALSNTPPRHSPLVPHHDPPAKQPHHPIRHPSSSSAFSLGSSSGLTSPARPSTPSTAFAAVSGGRPAQAPFRPGFQAKGVYRDLTEGYLVARRSKGETRRLDEGRLQKRLEKLVELHFPPPDPSGSKDGQRRRPNPSARASISSFSSLASLSSVAGPSPSNPSPSFFSRLTSASTTAALREAEQAIVKWQDDSTVRYCAICGAPFGVRTRKHHCRLCGRVVCFLPANVGPNLAPPSPSTVLRRERCSTFVTYEWSSPASAEKVGAFAAGELVELDEDEMGINPSTSSPSLASILQGASQPPKPLAADANLPRRKGVRVCRECLSIVLRRQAMQRPVQLPTYMRLHGVLAQLEGEVEGLLEDFAEHIVEMHRQADQPLSSGALGARKRLLSTLASYDSTARRISNLPLAGGHAAGGAQDRLQRAIGLRAAVFLQERMAMLRGLGAFELDGLAVDGADARPKSGAVGVKTLAQLTAESPSSSGTEQRPDDSPSDEDRAARLAVLLEQETLVKGYLEEAQARRQLEDASSLNASLDDLRAEIRALRRQ